MNLIAKLGQELALNQKTKTTRPHDPTLYCPCRAHNYKHGYQVFGTSESREGKGLCKETLRIQHRHTHYMVSHDRWKES